MKTNVANEIFRYNNYKLEKKLVISFEQLINSKCVVKHESINRVVTIKKNIDWNITLFTLQYE